MRIGTSALKFCLFLFHPQERVGSVDHFDIVERVEMGQMASMFFNKGKNCLCFKTFSLHLMHLTASLIHSDLHFSQRPECSGFLEFTATAENLYCLQHKRESEITELFPLDYF